MVNGEGACTILVQVVLQLLRKASKPLEKAEHVQCAVEPYSLILELGSVIHCSHSGKPQELRNSLLAKSAALNMKVDTPARSCGCRFTSLLWDQSSFNQKSKEVEFVVKQKE